jgi:threonylcarbamoyladenosine tRNA methylthiotransferase MtaB
VTLEAARKSRQLLRRCQRTNPRARLVLSGCLATLEGPGLARELGADLLVDNRDKGRLVEIAIQALSLPVLPALASEGDAQSLFARGRQRAFVKVQDGCRYACTFCVTTLARGEERSRPIAEVVAQASRLDRAGVREVLLSGVHLGGYGSDLGSDLAALLRALLRETRMPRIRLGSLEPWDLPPDLWELFGDPRLMPHLHLPMQSGSDAVLRRMARRCKTAEFARLAELGRAAVPGLNLTTDIIVGFPGETGEEWRRTLRFVEDMGFGDVHAFAYSPRAGTRAANLPDPVDESIKRERGQELRDLTRRLRAQALAAQIGQRAAVLREATSRYGGTGDLFGYTPNYLPVLVESGAEPVPVGEVMDVHSFGLDAQGEALRGCQIA